MLFSGFIRLVAVCTFALPLSACTLFYPEWSRLPVHEYRSEIVSRDRTLLIMLPGRFDDANSFMKENFVETIRKTGLPIDISAAEAHIAYYYDCTVVERIHEDLVIPAREKGYSRIWILGVSLGGLGGLWYDRTYPGEVDGLILLAPYLGEKFIAEEVERAGGLRSWRLKPGDEGTFDKDIWSFFKEYEDKSTTDGRLFLGYGLKDGFARANGLLAAVIPESQVAVDPGGHDWKTWHRLFTMLLNNVSLRKGLEPNNSR